MTVQSGSTPPPDHAEALRRSLVAIRSLRQRVSELEARTNEPIAIVGMACRFPGGASTPERYWSVLRDGIDATVDVPATRWDVDSLYDPDPEKPGRMYVRRGGFLLEPVDGFDPGFFDISPREAAEMDPIHRMLLELAWECLEHAGIPAQRLAGSDAGVFIGLSGSDYNLLQSRRPFDEIEGYGGMGSAACIASGRLSHFLGLQGPNVALDTACSAGLVAVVQAVESLRARQCSIALAGSSHLMLSPQGTIFLCRMRALSPDGRCRTFDAGANGYGRAEGGAMLVLKRLSDAQAAGDRIYAVIRGVAWNHDGRSSGLTVPNPEAQRNVITAALRNAGLAPEQIDYVEAHGTATPLGDPIELRALGAVLGAARSAADPLLIGSVKTNFGHLEASAGLAGLMKVVLSLRHEKLPPHINFSRPTPHVDWDRLPIRVVTELTEWAARGGEPRRAGVSAFGFSGTNAHVIVEQAPAVQDDPKPARPAQIILISGRTPSAVRELAGRWRAAVDGADDARLADFAATSSAGRSHLTCRAFAVAGDSAEMSHALQRIERLGDEQIARVASRGPGRLAFLFTGQGSQYPRMARTLCETSPVFRKAIERCAEIIDDELDVSLLTAVAGDVAPEVLRRTDVAQPALFAIEYALTELWRSWGIEPDFVLGHSLGEYSAAVAAGVMSAEDALRLVALRGRLMQPLQGGRMVAAFVPEPRVRAALEAVSDVAIAAVNGPENIVVSGSTRAVQTVIERLGSDAAYRDLEVSHAFHSPLQDAILDDLEKGVAAVTLRAPRIPMVSNLTGELLTDAEATDPRRWRRHAREPVLFARGIATLVRQGVQTFVEIGPHAVLTGLGRAVEGEPNLRWLSSLRRDTAAWTQLLDCVGNLYAAGYELDWDAFVGDFAGRRVEAPTYPFERRRYWFSDGARSGAGGGARSTGRSGHPLVGAVFESPAFDGWVLEKTLSALEPAYLAEHRVLGRAVVPGVAYLEMFAAAARFAVGWQRVRLDDVTLLHPLMLSDDERTTCQVLLKRMAGGVLEASVVSRPEGSETWSTHATATITALESAVEAPDEGLELLQRRLREQIDVSAIYERIAAHNITYGPGFRCLTEAVMGPGEALGTARLPGPADEHHVLHPGLMDAGLQLLACLARTEDDEHATYMPAGFERITIFGSPGAACRIHARTRGNADRDTVTADVRYLDADGRVCVSVEGFSARPLRRDLVERGSSVGTGPAPLFRLRWEDQIEPLVRTPDATGAWLIVEGKGGHWSRACSEALRAAGGDVVVVEGGAEFERREDGRFVLDLVDPRHWTRLFESWNPPVLRGLLYLVGLDASTWPDGDPVEDALRAVMPLVELVRSGALPRMRDGIRLVTRGGAGPDCGQTDAWAAGSALWGFSSVLAAEHPELQCRAIDIGAGTGPIDTKRLLAHLLAEDGEDRIALDGGRARVARLVHRASAGGADHRPVPLGEAYGIEIAGRGTLDAVRYVSVPRRSPDRDEVEVRVCMTGLNFRDVLNVLGAYPGDPGAPGIEFAGRVVRVGEGVTGIAVGDDVIGIGEGAFSAYVTVPQHAVTHRPRGLAPAEAATIPLAFLTAEYGLVHLAGLRSGERVLIHAAAGGVGQAAVQLAQAIGAEVFATAGNEEKRALLRAQGVRYVFDSRHPSFADEIRAATGGEGVDVVLNSLTGPMLRRSLELLRPGGRFLELGKAEILDPATVARDYPSITYEPYDLGTLLIEAPADFQRIFRSVVARFETGELQPLRVRLFAAEQVVEAFRFMAQARHIGKVVVRSGAVSRRPLIRPDSAYLVTGGAGGVGLHVAKWLAELGAGAVVLAGRREPQGEARKWLDEAANGGLLVRFVACDVTRRDAVERLVSEAGSMGLPLRGVFHAAGVVDDGLLESQTRERFSRVIAPKVAGAWHLHRATRHLDLDHFVLFSSVSGLIGGSGQSAYAAANAMLDALAEHRAAEGLAATSIGWGAWQGDGMIARMAAKEREMLERRGLGFLDPDSALAAMQTLLDEGDVRALAAKIDWQRVAAASASPPPLISPLLAEASRSEADAAPARYVPRSNELLAMEPSERLTVLERYVKAMLADVLRVAESDIDSDAELLRFGFDSIMAVEVRNRIEREMGLLVPASELLAGSTVRDLCAALERKFSIDSIASTDGREEEAWTEGEI